jgi:phage tail-like protein
MENENVLALVRIIYPDGAEQVVPITQTPFNIGRVRGNDLQLPDGMVSRQHARLLFEGDRIHLIDLNSSNGTMVGETRLTPNEPCTISYDEAFRVGPYTLYLEAAPVPVSQKAPESELEAEVEMADAPPPPSKPEPDHEAEIGAEDVPAPPPEPEASPKVKIGVTAAPPPPPPPSELLPPSEEGRPSYEEAFGLLPERSRYLQYLPPMYDEHPFLGRFLLAFEGIMAPIEQTVDHFDLYLDSRIAPAFFLDQLASWLGLTLDEKWPLEKRRAVVAEAAELYQRRGTRWSLSRHLEIYTDVTPKIIEPDDRPHHFRVVLRVPSGQTVDRATVERIIQANKPAHTTYTLEITGE